MNKLSIFTNDVWSKIEEEGNNELINYYTQDVALIQNYSDPFTMLNRLNNYYISCIMNVFGVEINESIDADMLLNYYLLIKRIGINISTNILESSSIGKMDGFCEQLILETDFKIPSLQIQNHYNSDSKKHDITVLKDCINKLIQTNDFAQAKLMIRFGEMVGLGDYFRLDFLRILDNSIKIYITQKEGELIENEGKIKELKISIMEHEQYLTYLELLLKTDLNNITADNLLLKLNEVLSICGTKDFEKKLVDEIKQYIDAYKQSTSTISYKFFKRQTAKNESESNHKATLMNLYLQLVKSFKTSKSIKNVTKQYNENVIRKTEILQIIQEHKLILGTQQDSKLTIIQNLLNQIDSIYNSTSIVNINCEYIGLVIENLLMVETILGDLSLNFIDIHKKQLTEYYQNFEIVTLLSKLQETKDLLIIKKYIDNITSNNQNKSIFIEYFDQKLAHKCMGLFAIGDFEQFNSIKKFFFNRPYIINKLVELQNKLSSINSIGDFFNLKDFYTQLVSIFQNQGYESYIASIDLILNKKFRYLLNEFFKGENGDLLIYSSSNIIQDLNETDNFMNYLNDAESCLKNLYFDKLNINLDKMLDSLFLDTSESTTSYLFEQLAADFNLNKVTKSIKFSKWSHKLNNNPIKFNNSQPVFEENLKQYLYNVIDFFITLSKSGSEGILQVISKSRLDKLKYSLKHLGQIEFYNNFQSKLLKKIKDYIVIIKYEYDEKGYNNTILANSVYEFLITVLEKDYTDIALLLSDISGFISKSFFKNSIYIKQKPDFKYLSYNYCVIASGITFKNLTYNFINGSNPALDDYLGHIGTKKMLVECGISKVIYSSYYKYSSNSNELTIKYSSDSTINNITDIIKIIIKGNKIIKSAPHLSFELPFDPDLKNNFTYESNLELLIVMLKFLSTDKVKSFLKDLGINKITVGNNYDINKIGDLYDLELKISSLDSQFLQYNSKIYVRHKSSPLYHNKKRILQLIFHSLIELANGSNPVYYKDELIHLLQSL